jgi:glycerate 2-kinase
VTVWHGETTVPLCERPGRGGRNRHLALAAAQTLDGRQDCALLALATDGEDHADAAGALVDGGTLGRGRAHGRDARTALAACDSGRYLDAAGDALPARATGTNLRDLAIGYRAPS